jgi:hypothetical protein
MRLTSISVSNFKGQSFARNLSSLNMVIGENWVGKTTLTDAIRLLLVGYLPELGKAKTSKLMSGREMLLRGVFDTGETITRKWFVSGDSIKSGAIVPPTIEQFAGMNVMLNADEYFAKSDRERVDYVTAMIPMDADEWSPIVVQEKIRQSLASPDPEAGYTPADVESYLAKLDDVCTEAGFENPQQFVALAIESTKTFAKESADLSDKMQRTIQGLAYLRAQDETGGASISSIEQQIGLLERELAELSQKKGVFIGSYDAIVKARERRKYLKKEIEAGAKDRLFMADQNASKNAGEDALSKLAVPGLDALGVMAIENANLLSGAKSIRIQIDSHKKTVKEQEKALQDLDAAPICPYCGATGDNWKMQRAAELVISIEGFSDKVAELVKVEEHALQKWRDAVAAWSAANQVQTQADTLSRQISVATREIHRLTGLISRLDTLNAELDQLPAEDALLQQQVDDVQTSINVKTDSQRNLKEVHRKAMARAGDLQRLAEAEEQRDEAKREIEVIKGATVALREIQAQMVSDVFVPLLNKANALFGDMLRSPLSYKAGEIGTWRDGLWVAHNTFSGTEKALAYAAIQIALSASSPFGVMILDEMGRISDANLPRVLFRIDQALKAGDLNQFVGIDVGREVLYRAAIDELGAQNNLENITYQFDVITG